MKTKIMRDRVVLKAYHYIGVIIIGVMTTVLLIAAATTAAHAFGF